LATVTIPYVVVKCRGYTICSFTVVKCLLGIDCAHVSSAMNMQTTTQEVNHGSRYLIGYGRSGNRDTLHDIATVRGAAGYRLVASLVRHVCIVCHGICVTIFNYFSNSGRLGTEDVRTRIRECVGVYGCIRVNSITRIGIGIGYVK